jgi:phosphonate degradation associated HDIG domain protein
MHSADHRLIQASATLSSPGAIITLWQQRGALSYAGEAVTQWQHGWQCARLAAAAGASAELQLAAWLHDLGHLMTDLAGSPTLAGIDDGHEALAAPLLGALFGDAVAEPVRLHVQAKRCLVGSRPGYRSELSADSMRSLALQGGPMSEAECAAFLAMPHARDAMRLRTWDDRAKDAALHPASEAVALAELAALMDRVAQPRGGDASQR